MEQEADSRRNAIGAYSSADCYTFDCTRVVEDLLLRKILVGADSFPVTSPAVWGCWRIAGATR